MKVNIARARTIELRKAYRYQLSAPVLFYWANPSGPTESGDGMTSDIDTTGAYINSCELPPVGALVQMDVMLPTLSGGGAGAHLTGEGVVLRVEPSHKKAPGISESGFAVSMQFYMESSESFLSQLKRSGRLM